MQPLPHDLEGACGVASLHILNLANKNGMKPYFVQGNFLGRGYEEGHCWIEYANNIVDITATQFKQTYDKVFIRSLRKPRLYKETFRTKVLDEAEARILNWANYAPELRTLAG